VMLAANCMRASMSGSMARLLWVGGPGAHCAPGRGDQRLARVGFAAAAAPPLIALDMPISTPLAKAA
jgi:hypothetical protein